MDYREKLMQLVAAVLDSENATVMEDRNEATARAHMVMVDVGVMILEDLHAIAEAARVYVRKTDALR